MRYATPSEALTFIPRTVDLPDENQGNLRYFEFVGDDDKKVRCWVVAHESGEWDYIPEDQAPE